MIFRFALAASFAISTPSFHCRPIANQYIVTLSSHSFITVVETIMEQTAETEPVFVGMGYVKAEHQPRL